MSQQPLSTQVKELGTGQLELDEAELRITSGPDRGTTAPLASHGLLIGSAPECDLVLHDPTVSARHAEVVAGDRGYVLRDLGSKNGVLLHGFSVERLLLSDRMKLELGDSTLTVRALGQRQIIRLARAGHFQTLVAHSVKMRAVVAELEHLAASDTTVLLEGETGCGKEVAAQALHRASRRAQGPFVVFDCGATQPALFAAELFGHERGAFSGATTARKGMLADAEGGTLLLDEVGEIPLEVQPALLRAIETRRVRPVGGDKDVEYDLRIVAATHRNLREEVRRGRFREDLYYRLAVACVHLPPLRHRPEDLPLLATAMAKELGAALTPDLLAVFRGYHWPGNVRELRNTIARLAARPEGKLLLEPTGADPIFDRGTLRSLGEARRLANEEFERRYLDEALGRAEGNVPKAAELAQVSRQFMARMARKYRGPSES